jgi:hypothetical protein
MKICNLLFLFLVIIVTSDIAHAQENYRVAGSTLIISGIDQSHACRLDESPKYAVESFDKSAVIVSDRGYVSAAALLQCTPDIPVHVSLIPSGVGVLADINLKKRIYVAVDFVSVRPFTYLATVARLNSSRNMVTLRIAKKFVRKFWRCGFCCDFTRR